MMPPSSRRAFRAEKAAAAARQGSASKAGRNLPAAIAVGLALGALIVPSVLFWPPGFVALVTVTVGIGAYELIDALAAGRIRPPAAPVLIGAVSLVPVAYVAGEDDLVLGFGLTCVAILLWRTVDGLDGAVRDVAGGVFITMYVALLAGFSSLLLSEADGGARLLVFLITTVASDIGGYAVGVLAGSHPMAPSVSPKKSWEGFAGSLVCCMVAGWLTVTLMLHGTWWAGVLLGAAVAVFATIGDLAESTIKRDLGIKDMGSILPGHGGVMDRLDSLVVTVPVAWLLLTWLVPA